MNKLVIKLYKVVKGLLGEIANLQLKIDKLEEDSHPPVNWEEIIYSNIERIERLERKLIERDSK